MYHSRKRREALASPIMGELRRIWKLFGHSYKRRPFFKGHAFFTWKNLEFCPNLEWSS